MFPGQGAQFQKMGHDFFVASDEARAVYERADQVLGFGLSQLIFEGSDDDLAATDICQPAILVTSLAIIETLKKRRGLEPKQFRAALGLSLGEYSALAFAQSMAFDDAVRLVRKRGQAMQAASKHAPSGMLSPLNATEQQVEQLVQEGSKAGVLVAANYLAPGNITLSGDLNALARAEAVAKEIGIRRTIRLKVAGAFHSPLMAPAANELRASLESVKIQPPVVPVISNVTAEPVSDPEKIREQLLHQLTSPVLWSQSISYLLASGVHTFVEPGPNKVLSKLAERHGGGQVKTVSIDTMADVENYESSTNAAGT
jgi:[acyl-carrier-protein] S-malonyltransferase